MAPAPFDVLHGWRLYMYPTFQEAFDGLTRTVDDLAARDPDGFRDHPKVKLLARVTHLILDEIPADPGHARFRQGKTLGPAHKDWFRAKFLRRFRLFYRFDTRRKIIIYCWINDETTLRKAGAGSDPYAVFARMLAAGRPPGDWDDLMADVVGRQ